MKTMRRIPSKVRVMALALGVLGVLPACLDNQGQTTDSALATAGGKVDTANQFASSVYVKVFTKKFDGNSGPTIANVGTLVDLADFGAPSHAALVVSLNDAFSKDGSGKSELPPLASLSIQIFVDDRAKLPVEINDIRFKEDGTMEDNLHLLGVGLEIKKREGSDMADERLDQMAQRFSARFLSASPLVNPKTGKNYRKDITSFLMLAIPKARLGQASTIRLAKAVPAASRVADADLIESLKNGGDMRLVGFGTTSDPDAKTSEGGIKTQEETRRNAAKIYPLVASKSEAQKGFSFTKEIWEVAGSGLCGSADGTSYDTGASILWRQGASGDYVFLGFGVSTTSISNGFRGKADCAKVKPADMATMVVSPSEAHYRALASGIR